MFLLASLLPWKLVKSDLDDELEISFLKNTLVLRVKLGATTSTSEGSFAGQPSRLVTDLTLTSVMKGMLAEE